MRGIRCSVCSFVCVVFLLGSAWARPQEGQVATADAGNQDGDENALICSVFSVALALAENIESGDVLLLQSENFDGIQRGDGIDEEGSALAREIFRRVVFDAQGTRFLVVTSERFELLELAKVSGTDDGRTLGSRYSGRLVDQKARTVFESTPDFRFARQAPFSLFEKSGGLDRYSDPRGAFLPGFPRLIEAKERIPILMTGDRLLSNSDLGGELELQLNGGRDEQQKTTSVVSYHFDRFSSLPLRVESFVRHDDGGKTRPNVSRTTWGEHNGTSVPVRFSKFEPSRFTKPDRSVVNAPLALDIQLHWISINEQQDPSLFDKSVLQDFARLKDLTDPVKAGANTLEFGERSGDSSGKAVAPSVREK